MNPLNEAAVMAELIQRAAQDPSWRSRGPERVIPPVQLAAPFTCDAPRGRWQDCVIEREIPEKSSVLDLGCGDGDLLSRLIDRLSVRAQGVELDPHAVGRCVARGVPVVQADLDAGLRGFGEGSFDYVILEETLQTLRRPLDVLAGMLRVARRGIVSFPNFGFWKVRLDLALDGRMPITDGLPHRWHDTPNIHLLTLRDFIDWTVESDVFVHRGFALGRDGVHPLRDDDNLFAEEVLLVLGR